MKAKRANPRHIKLHRSYSVEEIARTLGVHKNSVRGWRKDGLEPIDASRPLLFQGGQSALFWNAATPSANGLVSPAPSIASNAANPARPLWRWSIGCR
jgi:hypothetical protein